MSRLPPFPTEPSAAERAAAKLGFEPKPGDPVWYGWDAMPGPGGMAAHWAPGVFVKLVEQPAMMVGRRQLAILAIKHEGSPYTTNGTQAYADQLIPRTTYAPIDEAQRRHVESVETIKRQIADGLGYKAGQTCTGRIVDTRPRLQNLPMPKPGNHE